MNENEENGEENNNDNNNKINERAKMENNGKTING